MSQVRKSGMMMIEGPAASTEQPVLLGGARALRIRK